MAALNNAKTTPLFTQWLTANTLVPQDDEQALTGLARRASIGGRAPETLVELREWTLALSRTLSDAAQANVAAALAAKPTATLETAAEAAAAARRQEIAAAEAARRLVEEQRKLVEEQRKLVEEERRLEEAKAAAAERRSAREKASRELEEAAAAAEQRRARASREAEAAADRRRADYAASARRVAERDDDARWASFWAKQPAKLRGDLKETADGYEVELRGDGADGLEVFSDRGALRVRGVLVPGPAAKARFLSAGSTKAMLRRLGGGRYGAVDEVVRLPAAADLARATKEARGDSLVVAIPRKPLHRPRVPYGRALYREPSYPPLAVGGPGFYW